MYRRIALLSLAFLLLFALSASVGTQPAAAQQTSSVTVTITAGFDDHVKTADWFPVKVLLENNGPAMNGEIVLWFDDGGSSPGSQFSYPVDLASVSRKEITLLVYASNWNATLNYRLLDSEGKSLVYKKANLYLHSEGDALYGIIAANPTPFNQLSLIDPASGSASIAMMTLEDLPENSRGLESLTILAICGVDTGGMTPNQARALAEWVSYGGSLILCGGPDWLKTQAGLQANDTTRSLLPVTQIQTISIQTKSPDLIQIMDLVPVGTPSISAGGPDLTVIATGKASPDSTILAEDSQGRPLVVVRQSGSGNVIYLSADPSIPPFSTWTGLEPFFRALLNNSQQQPEWNAGITQWWNAVSASETFSSLRMPPILLICGFLFVYMLILGPANYLLLRMLNRREMGWITTPVLIIAITLGVFVTGSLNRTGKPVLNRLALVQIWPVKSESDKGQILARVDGVVGIYSPNRSSYRVDFEKPFIAHSPATDSTSLNTVNFTQDSDQYSVKDVRIDVSGIRTLGVEGSLGLDNFPYELTANLQGTSATLTGSFTNSSPYTLEDAVIITTSHSWSLGDIPPGQTIKLDLGISGGTSGPTNNPGVVKPVPPPGGSPGLVYSYFNSVDAILGTSNYWQDRETYRRYNFLTSFAFSSYYGTGYMQVNGFYLAAWSQDQVIPVSIANRQTDGEDTTLFMIALTPEFFSTESVLTLEPSMFSWRQLESSNNPATPYNMYLYSSGNYALEFDPVYKIDFKKVKSLIFTIDAINGSAVPNLNLVTFSLYNFSLGEYEPVEGITWGDNEIPDADRYVSPTGVIRLKVDSELGYLELSRTDFTLVIER